MNDDGNEDGNWWDHFVNALSAGYELRTQRAQKLAAEREAARAARSRARAGSTGSFGSVPKPKKRVRLDDDKPCCNGPRAGSGKDE